MDNAYPYSFLRQLETIYTSLELAEGHPQTMMSGSYLTTGQRAHIIKNKGAILTAIKAQLVAMGEMLNRVEQATTWSALEQVVAAGYEAWQSGTLHTDPYERVTVCAAKPAHANPPNTSHINHP